MNIIITGAGRGIGKAIALQFGKSGFNKFFLTYNKTNINDMLDLKEELEDMCNEVIHWKMDVIDRKNIEARASFLKITGTKIDVLINNAGILRDRTLSKMTYEEWDEIINTNLTGTFNITKVFLPYIQDGGCIINMGSTIGITGGFGQCNYSASKAGVIAFTKSLAKELAKRNIRVNSVSPTCVNTDIFQKLTPEQYAKLIDRMPFKRFATTEEIAKFVVFLAKEATYCTGENYVIGGSM